jgi:hypothetical protein
MRDLTDADFSGDPSNHGGFLPVYKHGLYNHVYEGRQEIAARGEEPLASDRLDLDRRQHLPSPAAAWHYPGGALRTLRGGIEAPHPASARGAASKYRNARRARERSGARATTTSSSRSAAPDEGRTTFTQAHKALANAATPDEPCRLVQPVGE